MVPKKTSRWTRTAGLLLNSGGKTPRPHAVVAPEPSGWVFTSVLPPNPTMGISAASDGADLGLLPVQRGIPRWKRSVTRGYMMAKRWGGVSSPQHHRRYLAPQKLARNAGKQELRFPHSSPSPNPSHGPELGSSSPKQPRKTTSPRLRPCWQSHGRSNPSWACVCSANSGVRWAKAPLVLLLGNPDIPAHEHVAPG